MYLSKYLYSVTLTAYTSCKSIRNKLQTLRNGEQCRFHSQKLYTFQTINKINRKYCIKKTNQFPLCF